MIEEGLTEFLSDHAVVGPLVKDAAITRVFPLLIPEHVRGDAKKIPCIVYQRVGTFRGGTFCETDSLAAIDLQLDIYSKSYLECKTLAQKVRQALVDFTGSMGESHVAKVFIGVEFDLVETDTGLYRVSQTYTFWAQEP
jgi:hypothetical protein